MTEPTEKDVERIAELAARGAAAFRRGLVLSGCDQKMATKLTEAYVARIANAHVERMRPTWGMVQVGTRSPTPYEIAVGSRSPEVTGA